MRFLRLRRSAAVAMFGLLCSLALVGPHGGEARPSSLPEPVGMPGDAGARLVLAGNAAFLAGDLARAERSYRSALRVRPELAVARFNLGLVEVHTNARPAGIRDMDRGIALAKSHRMDRAFVTRLRALRAAFVNVPTADA